MTINIRNRNSSFRKQIFDVACSSFREILDGYPNDDHYKNFTRDQEFLVNLGRGTQLYGMLLPGIWDGAPKCTTSLFSLLLAGQLVPEASGVGYKQHYCRAATQSIFENLLYFRNGVLTGPNATVNTLFVEDVRHRLCHKLEYSLLQEIVDNKLRIHSTHLQDLAPIDLYCKTSENAAVSATLEVFRRAMVFFKNSMKWMTDDYPISIGDTLSREYYTRILEEEEDNKDSIKEDASNFFPEEIFDGYSTSVGVRLRTICNSVRLWMLCAEGGSAHYHYLYKSYPYHWGNGEESSVSTSRLNRSKKNVKALVIAFLLAPGLFLDELCVAGECISDFRSRLAHNMSEADMYSKFAIINTDPNSFFNPVSQLVCRVETPIRTSLSKKIVEAQNNNFLGQSGYHIQKVINQLYYTGYFRSLAHPEVLNACSAIAAADKFDYKMFKEYWEKLQKEEDLHFNLKYKKPKG